MVHTDRSGDATAQQLPRESELALVSRVVWQGRGTVLATMFICAGLMTAYAFLATPWYRAQASLLPVEDKSAQRLLGQLGGLSGLASIAGITPSAGNTEPLAALSSSDFARSFIEAQNLLPILFAEKWDATTGKWKANVRETPDLTDAVVYFEKNVRRVGEDRKTGLIILTVEWKDPTVAASWANAMTHQINARMRARAITDAESSIAYLRSELQATTQVSLQQSISRLLESQMQNLMVARGNEEFAFRVIDTAHAPKERFKPQRTLLILGAALIGAFVAGAALILLSARQAPLPKRNPPQ
jgi:uncharacterized protein involved in exopolysaccharide biosynthesis